MNTHNKSLIPSRPVALAPGRTIIRTAFAHFCAEANPMRFEGADDAAEKLFPRDDAAIAVTRATTSPATTGGSGNGAELIGDAVFDFLGALAPLSAGARIVGEALTVPMDRGPPIKLPSRDGAPTALTWLGEGDAIPVLQRSLTAVTAGPVRKLAGMAVCSRELAKRAAGLQVFGQILREDAALGLDSAMFSTAENADIGWPGLLYGVDAIASAADAADDLANLAVEVSALGSGQVMFAMNPRRAARFPFNFPDLRATILPSLAVPADRVIAIDPLSLWVCGGREVDVTTSRDAVVHADNDPDPIVTGAPATAAPVLSAFQTDHIVTRVLLDIAFGKRRSGAVAYVDSVIW